MNYKIFKALEKLFIQRLFQEKLGIYFPALKNKKIKKVEIERTSPVWAKETCLVRYKVFFEKEKVKIIRGTAQKNDSKKDVWEIINYFYHHGFNKGNLLISKPVAFLKEINLLLYEEAEGKSFSSILEKGNYSRIKKNLKKIAEWLARFHSFHPKKYKFRKASFINPKDYLKIFKKIRKLIPELKKELGSFWNLSLIDNIYQKKKNLIHGDFYPGNIIINKNIVSGIDFDRAGFGPPLIDVAALCASFEFPQEIWKLNLSKKEISNLQEFFFQTYCQLKKISYQENKKVFRLFLSKIFLDRVYDYSNFTIKGWNFMDNKARKSFASKIKSLLAKLRKYLL